MNKKRCIFLLFFLCCWVLLLFISFENVVFKNEELNYLSIYLEEEQINYIPEKDSGYTLDLTKSSCNHGVTISFDYNTWSVKTNYSNYTNPDNTRVKCSLYFRYAEEYTISYDLNGGAGNIVNQIKIEGKTLLLTEQVPTKENYTFLGWSTTKDGKIEYKSGAEFEKNEDTILYAVYGVQYLYHYGNQFVSDTGGWSYTRTFNPSLDGSTTMKENDVVTFANQYIEWKEIEPEIQEYGYYGSGFFRTQKELDLSNAKSIHFEYEILVATPAIAPSDGKTYYPAISFMVVNSNNETLEYFSKSIEQQSDSIEILNLELNNSNLKNAGVKIELLSTGTSRNELQFRLYSVYVTY